MAEKQDLELGEAGKSGGKKKLLIIVGILVLVLAIGGGAAFFLLKKDPAAEAGPDGEAAAHEATEEPEEELPEGAPSLLYIALNEPLIANLPSAGKSRTVKLQVVFAVKTPNAELAVKKHVPLLSSELLMLLSTTDADQLMTAEGQQAFRDQALAKAREAIEREEKKPLIERILITQFVMQ